MMGFFCASIPLLLLSLLFTSPVVAQTKLEIIPLKNRLIEEVFPIIWSILEKLGTVTAMQCQLIIRAPPKALQDVKHMPSQIDVALKNIR